MLTRHHGLLILLLFAVAAHASLVERWFGRQPPGFQIGFAVLFAPILLVLLGEWIAGDAATARWRRRGWLIALVGALWHLVLDILSLSLLGEPALPWPFLVLGVGLGALVMGLVLRRAWRGVSAPEQEEPDPAKRVANESPWGRLQREAALFGGTPIALCLISLGFVGMAALGMWRSPAAWPKLLPAGGFFALCGAVGVWMGLERRAMLLRQPSPFAGLRPRWLSRSLCVATQEGLALLDRRGATLYRWGALWAVSLGEYQGNAAVFLDIDPAAEPQRLAVDGQPMPRDSAWLRKQARSRVWQRTLADCDLLILGVVTKSGPGVLAEELGRQLASESEQATLPTVAQALAEFLGPPDARP